MERLIVGIGELLWDILPNGKQIGGAPANFAYHAAQFGYKSVIISAIGNDCLGDEILSVLNHKGIDYRIERVDYPTGTVLVDLDKFGIPKYEIKEGVAWDNIPLKDYLVDIAHNTSAFCYGTLAQRNTVSRNTINFFLDNMQNGEDSLKIFDVNLRQNYYNVEIIEQSLYKCNVLKINDDEFKILCEIFLLHFTSFEKGCLYLLNKYNLKIVILTCGVLGSYIFTDNEISFIDTPKVDVLDTVGAGDSFSAAFCSSLLSGCTIKQSHRIAVDVAAYVCTQSGAMPYVPNNIKQIIEKRM